MTLDKQIIERVVCWVESAVIGLNLCPFAESVFMRQGIKYVVSESRDTGALLADLSAEIICLQENTEIETTLLIIPSVLLDFEDYNNSLDLVDALLDTQAWTGEFQIASFHPQYRYEGTHSDDRENWSNRSPYPIYHILRESSVALAIENHPAPDQIPVNNIQTLNSLTQKSFDQIFLADHGKKLQ